MFIAGHAVAGAVIGQQLGGNPILVFILAFISHFLLDIVPHGDGHHVHDYYHGGRKKLKSLYSVLTVDAIATIIFVSWAFAYLQLNRVSVAWGIIGGVIPDLLVGLSEIWKQKWLKFFTKLHFVVHNALIDVIKVKPWPGAVLQLIIITLLIKGI